MLSRNYGRGALVPSRRAQVAMTDDEVRDYVANGRTLVLVTNGPDGVPDPPNLACQRERYVTDPDGTPVMRTFTKSQKVRNVLRDPRAGGLVEDGDRYAELRGGQLTGRVETFDDVERILDVLAALAVKYEGKQTGLRLVAERVVSWDHAKLGGRY